MRIRAIVVAFLLAACRAPHPAPALFKGEAASPSPEASGRVFRIRLTLSLPSDLLVVAGEKISSGALLTNRSATRSRLYAQIEAIRAERGHLRKQIALTDSALRQLRSLGPGLPARSFATEQISIRKSETSEEIIQKKTRLQETLLASTDGYGDALQSDQVGLIRRHEALKLDQLRDERLLAGEETQSHRARLDDSREAFAYDEKKHRVDYMRQLLTSYSQREQSLLSLAHLTSQLIEAQLKLDQTAEVRSPFSGTVKRIDWEEMNDERIIVVVYLAPEK